MKRYIWPVLFLMSIGSGCTPVALPLAGPALLFDRLPVADAGGWSGWQRQRRAAPSYVTEGETIYYREVLSDRQGDWPAFSGRVYRRFHLIREGRGYR